MILSSVSENSLAPVSAVSKSALINRSADFWLLGGISFVAWGFAHAAAHFYGSNSAFDRQISNWPFAFSALTLICNHPHFMSSYRIAYGNGLAQIKSYWFTLIAVPFTLLLLFSSAYFIGAKNMQNTEWFAQAAKAGGGIPAVRNWTNSLDPAGDLLRWSVWAMWILVGWHYAKQIYGIMLRYAKYDSYSLSSFQRKVLRYCLLSVVPASFIGLTRLGNGNKSDFQGLSMTPFEIPFWADQVAASACAISAALFLGCMIQNYRVRKSLPSINFLVPFFAFYLWWYPGLWPQPFAMIMIPFFHSLQYLPFAYKRIEKDIRSKQKQPKSLTFVLTTNIISILIVGFLFFDIIPAWLDNQLQTPSTVGSSFFVIAIVVFLNIHHFFIDSSIWKSSR